MKSDNISN